MKYSNLKKGPMKNAGPSLDTPTRKMKSLDAIMGVSVLEIDNETELIQVEILSPRSSLRELHKVIRTEGELL